MNRDEDFLFDQNLEELDPDTAEIISLEAERQTRKIILIASESICPRPVREALASVFTNLYAEGYPHPRMTRYERDMLLDYDRQLAYHRRYSDRKYYKGTDYVDFIEALAQKRVAELFATDKDPSSKVKIPPSSIYANVQPLSGAAANNAVYEAFLEPGDTVMGMSLTHGGHLTHGSPANRSGKRYNIISYGVQPETGRLDYNSIRELAMKYRPKLIIAGYSAYPWSVDWEKFAEIRDAVGDCILMADIAHPAGLVVAGMYPNPIGYADVITFTTHKTLCGPRGACILTTDEAKARIIDSAVFPGEQGGPHVNNIAAKAICFEIAKTEEFKKLQKKIVENAKYFASCIRKLGLKLAYGGTDSHMFLVDLRSIKVDGEKNLTAEVATRILDICGIVANKNTIAGDDNAVYPSGVRFGTTWITQRGINREQIRRLAELIYRVLVNIKPYEYIGASCMLGRGKIDLKIMEDVANEVEDLEAELRSEISLKKRSGYPHYFISSEPQLGNPLIREYERLGATLEERNGFIVPLNFKGVDEEIDRAINGAVLFDLQDAGLLEVYGERAYPFLQEVLTSSISDIPEDGCGISYILDENGRAIDDIVLVRQKKSSAGEDHFIICTNPSNSKRVKRWFRALSDGYIIFDREDIYRKIEGPVVVVDLKSDVEKRKKLALFSLQGPTSKSVISRLMPEVKRLKKWHTQEVEFEGLRLRVLHLGYGNESRFDFLLKSRDLVKFFGKIKRYFLKYTFFPGGVVAREEKRLKIGFPKYGRKRPRGEELIRIHPELFSSKKSYFVGQISILKTEKVSSKKKIYIYREKKRNSKRSWLYQEHLRLGGKFVEFAGWEMPVWYTRLSDEHTAVRQTAGLFDVSHMGIIEVKGDNATRFLDLVTTNYVPFLRIGQSQYSYLLHPDGEVIDDIMIYKRAPEKYLIVVNAANEEKDIAWLNAVNSKKYIIDLDNRSAEIEGEVLIRSLKEPTAGKDMKIDLALQGPNSLKILEELTDDPSVKRNLEMLMRGEFIEIELSGIEVMVSRTGYTGENIGYELFVHPDEAPRLWRLLLEKGASYGIKPAGLGARDSTRIEAGLPLYGNELAGPYKISPIEAGYGAFVKLHKPFFIGRKAMIEKVLKRKLELIRFRVNKKGQRVVKLGDPIVSELGENIGWVTSCALIEGFQQGIAFVERRYNVEGTQISIYPLPRTFTKEKTKSKLKLGDKVILPIEARVLTRWGQA